MKGIKRLKNLKKLELILKGCTQLTDEGQAYIGDSFHSLSQLSDINISFSGCYHITKSGMRKIIFGIKKPLVLRALSFDFTFCGGLDYKVAMDLTRGLSKITMVQHLNLEFNKYKTGE